MRKRIEELYQIIKKLLDQGKVEEAKEYIKELEILLKLVDPEELVDMKEEVAELIKTLKIEIIDDLTAFQIKDQAIKLLYGSKAILYESAEYGIMGLVNYKNPDSGLEFSAGPQHTQFGP